VAPRDTPICWWAITNTATLGRSLPRGLYYPQEHCTRKRMNLGEHRCGPHENTHERSSRRPTARASIPLPILTACRYRAGSQPCLPPFNPRCSQTDSNLWRRSTLLFGFLQHQHPGSTRSPVGLIRSEARALSPNVCDRQSQPPCAISASVPGTTGRFHCGAFRGVTTDNQRLTAGLVPNRVWSHLPQRKRGPPFLADLLLRSLPREPS